MNNIFGSKLGCHPTQAAKAFFAERDRFISSSQTNYVFALQSFMQNTDSRRILRFFNHITQERYTEISILNSSKNSMEFELFRSLMDGKTEICSVRLERQTPLKDDYVYDDNEFVYGVSILSVETAVLEPKDEPDKNSEEFNNPNDTRTSSVVTFSDSNDSDSDDSDD